MTEKYLKKEESLEILKILGLINEKWIKVSCTSSFMFNNTSWQMNRWNMTDET